MELHAGQITIAGSTFDVEFQRADDAPESRIGEAYRSKYRSSQYLAPMIGARSKAVTVKIVPKT